MQNTVTVPARTVTVDWTLPCVSVSFVVLALLVVALVAVLMANRSKAR